MKEKPKRPKDANQLAKLIADLTISEPAEDCQRQRKKSEKPSTATSSTAKPHGKLASGE